MLRANYYHEVENIHVAHYISVATLIVKLRGPKSSHSGELHGVQAMRSILVTLIICVCATRYIVAQSSVEAATNATAHVGAFEVAPSVIASFGGDSNVYNAAEHPRSDFTASVACRSFKWQKW